MTEILIILIILVVYLAIKKYISINYLQSILQIMSSQNNFNPNHYKIMANSSGAIAIDTNQNLLCIVNKDNQSFYLNSENLLNTEIMIDQISYHQKDFIKTWSKYLLLKSIGSSSIAEASVYMAKNKDFNKIKSLRLKIGTTNIDVPNHYLLFLKNGTEKHKRKILHDLHDWITRVETIKTSENRRFRIN